WQQVNLATPVSVTAGQTYVVSYFAPNGYYSSTGGQFSTTLDSPPLHALASGLDGANGVYSYSPTSTFPTDTWGSTNYWADVVFQVIPDTVPPTVASSSPGPGASAVHVAS